MKLILEINNKTKNKVNQKFLTKTAKATLREAGNFLADKNVSISLAIVGENEIKKLNKTYRHKNTPTDTLSFAEYKNKKEVIRAGDKNVFLGEVILCYNDIKKYCQKNKLNFNKELAKTFSHGLLHLLGFRHNKEMFAVQKNVSDKICHE